MLSESQWLRCARHHKSIRWIVGGAVLILATWYVSLFLYRFWWTNKIPPQSLSPAASQMYILNCRTDEVGNMFIPSVKRRQELGGDLRNYVPDPLERGDARILLLENYATLIVGSEILEKRPECLGAFIADKVSWPEPLAILVVDRKTGKTVFRIARLQDSLTR